MARQSRDGDRATAPNTVRKKAAPNVHYTNILKPAWPNPALVMGLPKAGTKSIADYFKCGCYNVSHYTCNAERKRGVKDSLCGQIIESNIVSGVDPLLNTGDMDVYAQLDVTNERYTCYYPQMDALEELHKHHPNSTFILNTRNVNNWLDSVNRWGSMRKRFHECNLTDLPTGVGDVDEDMIAFFGKQVDRVRDFCRRHPSHALVEIDVESVSTGAKLESIFGIPSDCWGKNDHLGGNEGWRQKRSC